VERVPAPSEPEEEEAFTLMYHPQMSPRSLETVVDPLIGYPARWELMRWYTCWRKYPYPTEVIAALVAEGRRQEYAHYPCPLDPTHWHIGRGGGQNPSKKRHIQAKRVYRKAVRDEIWRAHVVREEEQERERDREGTVGALAD
jgi:hypothetical protein